MWVLFGTPINRAVSTRVYLRHATTSRSADTTMRVAIYDRVEPPVPAQLPLRLTQTCSQRAAIALLVLVVPAALGGTVRRACRRLAGAPGARRARRGRAASGARPRDSRRHRLSSSISWRCRRAASWRAFRRTRTVEIADGLVSVTEGGHFRSWAWAAPLASFTGVAHHVRASLSGTRHELILVHPTRAMSVLLSVAPRTTQSEVDRVATLLGHKEIPPSELYRFKALWPRMTPAPLPDAAHA